MTDIPLPETPPSRWTAGRLDDLLSQGVVRAGRTRDRHLPGVRLDGRHRHWRTRRVHDKLRFARARGDDTEPSNRPDFDQSVRPHTAIAVVDLHCDCAIALVLDPVDVAVAEASRKHQRSGDDEQ